MTRKDIAYGLFIMVMAGALTSTTCLGRASTRFVEKLLTE